MQTIIEEDLLATIMSETPSQTEEKRTVQAVQFSCGIVDALKSLDGAGVTEIANYLDASKGAVHTHLATLESNELVKKEGDTYRLSLRFLDLGEYVRNQVEIYSIVQEEIDRLAENSSEVAQFMIEEHGRGVYLHKSIGEDGVQTASYVGTRNPLHCTALGKSILANLSEEQVDEIIDRHGLPEKTPNTVTDREELLEELERVRDRGLAFDREEVFKGLQCVAAPVLDQGGEVIGAVSVTGPKSRMQGEYLESEVAKMVQHTSNVIEVNAAQIQ